MWRRGAVGDDPADLRARVTAFAKRRRESGASWGTIKKELGQSFDTVRRWCVETATPQRREQRPTALVPVRVMPSRAPGRTVSVVSPAGFRVDGLTIAEAAALLREVG